MSFKLPKGVRNYFQYIPDKINASERARVLLFDKYYFCLIMGLVIGKRGSVENLEPEEFVKSYPEQYADKAELIAGLLIDAEMRFKDIYSEDRDSIEKLILKLVSLNSSTRLSDMGLDYLNYYAVTGFDFIREKIPKPATLDDFMVVYYELLDSIS